MDFTRFFCPCPIQLKVLSLRRLIDWLSEWRLPTLWPFCGNDRGIDPVVGAPGMPMASEVGGQMNLLSLQKCTEQNGVLSWQQ